MSSMECRDGPVLSHRRDRVTLSYDFPDPTGEYLWESVVFLGVAALGFTPRAACSRDQASASNRLIELEGSAWRNMVRGGAGRAASLRHLRITFELIGCYDLLALAFVPPPTDRPHGVPVPVVSGGSVYRAPA
jgi:hypothetical protein